MDYYRRYIGDYYSKTKHLSLAEHGAYTQLLDFCYGQEKASIPLEYEILYRICSCIDDLEREAVRKIADEFFPVVEGERRNKRLYKQLPEEMERIETNKSRAKRAAFNRWNAKRNATSTETTKPQAMRNECSPISIKYINTDNKTNTSNIVTNSPTSSNNKKENYVRVSRARPVDNLEEKGYCFEAFWKRYPKKAGKKDAREVWNRKNLESEDKATPIILNLEDRIEHHGQWKKGFIPNPARYL
ncbi:MAG: YdaU family protein, partial [Nitrososphaera sp.]|nr:YdaU family protein [Nitrososphaera sp.]